MNVRLKVDWMVNLAVAAAMVTAAAGGVKAQAYGGYYGFSDPTITVTPYGIVPLGYGYNGYTGTGYPVNPDWEMLRQIYAQGYQAALDSAAAPNRQVDEGQVSYPTGMTATPRGVVGRVPHGSDGVRMWRVGHGQVALRWQGDPRIASSVTFELTDRSGKALRRTTVSQLPAEVRFTPPPNAVYYQAIVHYIDGATNTVMSRLPH